MVNNKIGIAVLIVLIAVGFSRGQEDNKIRVSPNSKTFNPFNPNSWLSVPSEMLQYWFPFFRPAYYPSYLQRPTTPKPSEKPKETDKGPEKTGNIFGVSKPSDEDVEYLPPPSEIEW